MDANELIKLLKAASTAKVRMEVTNQFLQQEEGSINNKDNNKKRLLYLAAKKGYIEIVTLLLENAEVDSVNISGETALHVAARMGHDKTSMCF